MRKELKWMLFVPFVMLLFASCKNTDAVYIEAASAEQQEMVLDTQNSSQETEKPELDAQAENADSIDVPELCYVYVCGAVVNPGVYALKAHDRIYEAVSMAGGLREDACMESVNQAEEVADGQMIQILTQEEAAQAKDGDTKDQSTGEQNASEATNGAKADDGRINLNTASTAELMTLPGIGKAKADSIISYREQNGAYSSIEEIMKIEGIKEGVFNRIKDGIKVN